MLNQLGLLNITLVAFHFTSPVCHLRTAVSAKDLNLISTSCDISNLSYFTVEHIALIGDTILGLLQSRVITRI
jgi:hypothetical protein